MASSSITVPGTSTYLRCRPTDIPMRRRFGAAVVGLLLAACSSIGPATVPHDRIDYGSSIGNSWKEQTLLNIVKLRYADMPIFLEAFDDADPAEFRAVHAPIRLRCRPHHADHVGLDKRHQ